MIDPEYSTLTDIGTKFGCSSHVIGKWLAALGLRVVGGDPTPTAKARGLVKTAPTGRGEGDHPHPFFIWHTEKTVKLLENAGHRQVQMPEPHHAAPSSKLLVGPFSNRVSGTEGYEILNGNGNAFGWVTGEGPATWVVRLLNLADKHGKFP
jgi:hypothetical protein